MELFTQRLPDLTLKTFAEKTGFSYVPAQKTKCLLCTKVQLDAFLSDSDVSMVMAGGKAADVETENLGGQCFCRVKMKVCITGDFTLKRGQKSYYCIFSVY